MPVIKIGSFDDLNSDELNTDDINSDDLNSDDLNSDDLNSVDLNSVDSTQNLNSTLSHNLQKILQNINSLYGV